MTAARRRRQRCTRVLVAGAVTYTTVASSWLCAAAIAATMIIWAAADGRTRPNSDRWTPHPEPEQPPNVRCPQIHVAGQAS